MAATSSHHVAWPRPDGITDTAAPPPRIDTCMRATTLPVGTNEHRYNSTSAGGEEALQNIIPHPSPNAHSSHVQRPEKSWKELEHGGHTSSKAYKVADGGGAVSAKG
ncbi:hypothetical protein GW17_00041139 [Ensete ventricosum]|nr:hypothetical protein GW17_00041139 [Ensete ventricosum]